jgi:tRNA threonylcarbamoyladenosine dehydratase
VTADIDRRFGGMDRLYGVAGAGKLRQAHVVIVGIGGVGSWCAEALARSNIGRLTLIDLDNVSESNLNRQIHATTETVGMPKVDAMQRRIALFNPECQIRGIEEFLVPENVRALIPADADAVIDACDQVHAKAALAACSKENAWSLVTVGAAGGKRWAHLVELEDLSAVTHDPLLASVRNRLRKSGHIPREGRKTGMTCVFSRETVSPPDASCQVDGDGSLNCHGYGSVVTVTATFGMVAAGWTINKLSQV